MQGTPMQFFVAVLGVGALGLGLILRDYNNAMSSSTSTKPKDTVKTKQLKRDTPSATEHDADHTVEVFRKHGNKNPNPHCPPADVSAVVSHADKAHQRALRIPAQHLYGEVKGMRQASLDTPWYYNLPPPDLMIEVDHPEFAAYYAEHNKEVAPGDQQASQLFRDMVASENHLLRGQALNDEKYANALKEYNALANALRTQKKDYGDYYRAVSPRGQLRLRQH